MELLKKLDYYKSMSNILDYVAWRGDLSFEDSPFNEIDSLILCQILYLNFDGLMKSRDFSSSIPLHELAEIFKNSPDFEARSDTGLLINKLSSQLLLEAAKTVRFGNILATGYDSIIDLKKEEQFAAMTYIIEKKQLFVAYRGTDDTVVGWKEDCNLAIMNEVPAQKDAVLYLQDVASNLKGTITVAGHSKGGNLAVFASALCDKKIKNRIEKIYNNDGPGFTEKRLESQEFYEIIPKLCSFYPQLSIVGMIFRHKGCFQVVESDESGVMQHDPFSWHIKGKEFVQVDGFDKASKLFYDSFNKWIDILSTKDREIFVETLFEIIHATGAKTNSEIKANMFKNSVKILAALRKLSPELRKIMEEVLKSLFHIVHEDLPSFSELEKERNLKTKPKKSNCESKTEPK